MLSYLRDIRKIEALQAERGAALARAEENKAKKAADADDLRRDLARQISGMVASRQEQREQKEQREEQERQDQSASS